MKKEGLYAKWGFSGSTLKMIAIISMLIDHTAAVLVDQQTHDILYHSMRNIGRIAFPIFCFLLVQGFMHTKNLMKYATRLGVFALISEIPFDLAFYGDFLSFEHQNVFFTLFIGLLVLIGLKKSENSPLLNFLPIGLGCILAMFLQTDYSIFGVLLIVFFYEFYSLRIGTGISVIMFGVLLEEYYAILALLFIPLYNGKRGVNIKYFFYVFYPAHLFILFAIEQYLRI